MDFDEARHLLSRTSFGATPAEIRAFEAQDYAAAVDRLLASVRRDAADAGAGLDQPGTGRAAPPAAGGGRPSSKTGVDGKTLQVVRPVQEQGRELRNWWVEEMLATDQPLAERMVLFWHNHFTSSFQKVRYPAALFRQNALFRREALGNFATLLKDVARDPAMLIYLDGMRSVARQPNENFARELLELFTLGEGHYSEADIKAAARAFTGWTVDRETGAVPQPRPGSTTTARRPSSARPAASTATRSSPSCCAIRAPPRRSSRSCGASSSRCSPTPPRSSGSPRRSATATRSSR